MKYYHRLEISNLNTNLDAGKRLTITIELAHLGGCSVSDTKEVDELNSMLNSIAYTQLVLTDDGLIKYNSPLLQED